MAELKERESKAVHAVWGAPDENLDVHRGLRWVPLLFLRAFVKLFYRVEYVGVENIPETGPLLLTANHTSVFDVIAIVQRPKFWIYWVGKKELMKYWAARTFFNWWRIIPVDRKRLDLHTAKAMLRYLDNGKVIGIFPEGTRVPEGASFADYPPKSGVAHFAIRHNVPILPVAIEGRFKLFHKVRIIYGEPYKLEADKEQLKHESVRLSYEVMKRIYALIGVQYPDSPEGGELHA